MVDAYRSLRARHWDLSELADRAPRRPAGGTARRLVQVYNGGSMGSSPDLFYLTHPVELGGTETEGGTASSTVDSAQTIPVVFLGHAPSVGDQAVGYAVGGRWVAERGGTASIVTLPCSPCNIPEANLTLSWVNPILGNGATTLTWNPGARNWTSTACVRGQSYQLQCAFGQINFFATYYISGECPTGETNVCSSLSTFPFGLTLVSHTCSPFSMTWNTSPNCPNVESPGFRSFTVTA
jgi:hypothetical protein